MQWGARDDADPIRSIRPFRFHAKRDKETRITLGRESRPRPRPRQGSRPRPQIPHRYQLLGTASTLKRDLASWIRLQTDGVSKFALSIWEGRKGRSRRLLTNSISSIPSPVYQCTKAFRLYIAENCSPIRLKRDWMLFVSSGLTKQSRSTYEVELQMKVEDILRPRGGISLRVSQCI